MATFRKIASVCALVGLLGIAKGSPAISQSDSTSTENEEFGETPRILPLVHQQAKHPYIFHVIMRTTKEEAIHFKMPEIVCETYFIETPKGYTYQKMANDLSDLENRVVSTEEVNEKICPIYLIKDSNSGKKQAGGYFLSGLYQKRTLHETNSPNNKIKYAHVYFPLRGEVYKDSTAVVDSLFPNQVWTVWGSFSEPKTKVTKYDHYSKLDN